MKRLSEITAAILAGGLGTRLRPAVFDRPKVLAQVNGRPFLAYLLDQLADQGIRKVAMCTGYLGQQVEEAFGDMYRAISLCYSQEPSPLGTAGALRLALPLFPSPTVLVLNGDSYCQWNLKAFWTVHRLKESKATLLVAEVTDTSRFGRVEIEPSGKISDFLEKREARGPGWINAGVYLLSRSSIEEIPSGQVLSLEKDIFPTWVPRGIYGYRNSGPFLDIGTPESYHEAQKFFSCGGNS